MCLSEPLESTESVHPISHWVAPTGECYICHVAKPAGSIEKGLNRHSHSSTLPTLLASNWNGSAWPAPARQASASHPRLLPPVARPELARHPSCASPPGSSHSHHIFAAPQAACFCHWHHHLPKPDLAILQKSLCLPPTRTQPMSA
eukprot:s4380_g4.t1